MAKAKSAATTSPDIPIQIIEEATCPTSSSKSTLTYHLGVDDSEGIYIKVSANDGGGFFSAEWVSFESICDAIASWPEDQGITSMTFRGLFRGKSANTPGFLVAVLIAVGILEPEGEKKRVYQACNPEVLFGHVDELRNGTHSKTKPRAKAKAPRKAKPPPKAKAKSTPRAKATAKATRKSPAKPRKRT